MNSLYILYLSHAFLVFLQEIVITQKKYTATIRAETLALKSAHLEKLSFFFPRTPSRFFQKPSKKTLLLFACLGHLINQLLVAIVRRRQSLVAESNNLEIKSSLDATRDLAFLLGSSLLSPQDFLSENGSKVAEWLVSLTLNARNPMVC